MKRGEIVIVDFPFTSGAGAKVRPAVVIQNDRDNRRMASTVVAFITGNLSRAAEPTQLLIDPSTSDGASSGLHKTSAVNCCNLYTIDQRDVVRTIGSLSPELNSQLDVCLKAALAIA
jgi:mRNA interferase MazF